MAPLLTGTRTQLCTRSWQLWDTRKAGECESVTGYSPAALVGNRDLAFADLIHPDDRSAVRNRVQAALAEHRPYRLTYRIRCADDTMKWVWEQGCGVFAEESNDLVALEGYIVEITEQKRLEEHLTQTAKMEAVGQLAGGVAHDFNNVLAVILGCTEMALEEMPQTTPCRSDLEQVLKAARRAARLAKQLLAFSRRQVLQPQPLDLNATLKGMKGILKRSIGEDVQLRMLLEPNLGAVLGDRGQLEQVILNLACNARDAMPRGGKLTFATANVAPDERHVGLDRGGSPEPSIMLSVSDTGCGMTPEVQKRIFEPFFTTKEAKGTGLGLASLQGVVKQSGGSISVWSDVGGTTFEISASPCRRGRVPPELRPGRADSARRRDDSARRG